MAQALAQLSGEQPIDIAVANAGAVEAGSFLRSPAERFRRMTEINLIGTVNLFHGALPGMVERGHGRLIAIGSTAGHRGYAHVSAYVAAKHAVIGRIRDELLSLQTPVGGSLTSGVTVNAVSPGYADTDMVAGGLDAIVAKTGVTREQALAGMVKDNPQGRLIAPEEVAQAVLYLCGPASGAVTGQSLMINGGEF